MIPLLNITSENQHANARVDSRIGRDMHMCRYFEAHCGLVVIKDQLYRHDLQTAGDMQRLRSAVRCSGALHYAISCPTIGLQKTGLIVFGICACIVAHMALQARELDECQRRRGGSDTTKPR